MKITVKTIILQEMLSRAIKAVVNNKLLPITSIIGIKCDGNKLTLITSDATNYMYVSSESIIGDEFDVAVSADMFAKLISKMTCDTVVLNVTDNYLEIKGNGTYKLEFQFDESGSVIKFPDKFKKLDLKVIDEGIINSGTINSILTSIKPALAVTPEAPCYMGYYVGDTVVGTDTYKIARLNTKVFNVPTLISSELMNLVGIIPDTEIEYTIYEDGSITFVSDTLKIYGKKMSGIEDYSINAINDLISVTADSSCSISKTSILQLLDRLSLFVNPYDKNGIRLTFTLNKLIVESINNSGEEEIEYLSKSNVKEMTCLIDIEMLQSQIKSVPSDTITMYFGIDTALTISHDNLTNMVAFLDDFE